MADLWDQLVKKYPRYTIAILLVYALLVSAYTIYSSVRSYYIELKNAEACGNISDRGAHLPFVGKMIAYKDVLETINPSNYSERKL